MGLSTDPTVTITQWETQWGTLLKRILVSNADPRRGGGWEPTWGRGRDFGSGRAREWAARQGRL